MIRMLVPCEVKTGTLVQGSDHYSPMTYSTKHEAPAKHRLLAHNLTKNLVWLTMDWVLTFKKHGTARRRYCTSRNSGLSKTILALVITRPCFSTLWFLKLWINLIYFIQLKINLSLNDLHLHNWVKNTQQCLTYELWFLTDKQFVICFSSQLTHLWAVTSTNNLFCTN